MERALLIAKSDQNSMTRFREEECQLMGRESLKREMKAETTDMEESISKLLKVSLSFLQSLRLTSGLLKSIQRRTSKIFSKSDHS